MHNVIKELKEIKAKNIFLQIPEGLKTRAEELINTLEENGFDVICSMDPCFGACDIKPDTAKLNNCDAIVHLGHNKFLENNTIPIIYLPLTFELNHIDKLIKNLINYLKKEKINEIGFVTTIQYLEHIPKIKDELKKENIKLVTKKGEKVEEGQILGCNYSSAPNTKNIVYFGEGLFHPLGIHFSTQKEIIIFNPTENLISHLDKEKDKFLRERILLIEQAKDASEFAILISSKLGQNRIKIARQIKKDLEANGKKAKIYSMDFISQTFLLGINASAFINTACPRISIDDFKEYKKPIINFYEVEYLLGKSYDDYKIKMFY
ncbi:MAG: diphthamide biosynthesis enzyme Dph2 [Candidatus ainarchaeum sp.]|nr:diphthamide biosynthesis enzyme Dph2 [Candidatus ainarchaeum sp.]